MAIPLLYGARRDRRRSVDSGMRWPPRCRTLGMLSGALLLIAEEGIDAGNTGGRPKCMSGRQLARTGSNGVSGASWDMQQAAKSIRVRNAGVCAAFEAAAARQLAVCCSTSTRSSCAWKAHDATWSPTWRRGRGETPCVPHPPLRGMRKASEEKTGAPWGRTEHGAMTRVWSSVRACPAKLVKRSRGLFDN